MTRQEICNRFFFLEGLVNEHYYNQIVNTAINIANESREESAKWCDGLAQIYTAKVGFDIGYSMAAIRAAQDIRSQAWRE